jgi:hypothetical protein
VRIQIALAEDMSADGFLLHRRCHHHLQLFAPSGNIGGKACMHRPPMLAQKFGSMQLALAPSTQQHGVSLGQIAVTWAGRYRGYVLLTDFPRPESPKASSRFETSFAGCCSAIPTLELDTCAAYAGMTKLPPMIIAANIVAVLMVHSLDIDQREKPSHRGV